MSAQEIIRKAYFEKAREDRRTIRQSVLSKFGYGERTFNYKLKGRTRLTDKEVQFLQKELKLL